MGGPWVLYFVCACVRKISLLRMLHMKNIYPKNSEVTTHFL